MHLVYTKLYQNLCTVKSTRAFTPICPSIPLIYGKLRPLSLSCFMAKHNYLLGEKWKNLYILSFLLHSFLHFLRKDKEGDLSWEPTMAAVFKVFAAVFLVAVALCGPRVSAQTHHVVGNDRGWGPDLDVSSWLSGRVFSVGDKICKLAHPSSSTVLCMLLCFSYMFFSSFFFVFIWGWGFVWNLKMVKLLSRTPLRVDVGGRLWVSS